MPHCYPAIQLPSKGASRFFVLPLPHTGTEAKLRGFSSPACIWLVVEGSPVPAQERSGARDDGAERDRRGKERRAGGGRARAARRGGRTAGRTAGGRWGGERERLAGGGERERHGTAGGDHERRG
ncbi:hypothetical protein GQ55_5G085800 [Panicum hallii var. hallii]|uniref:Uncharacterized protein n=1 Tax=Panicum hallii var. hallii TaxID=1504633 RepID=A0A2T7DE69_9POAL|nr:hypothetical protein GQ55_5G085800 [Panicum hallii var. hallii]